MAEVTEGDRERAMEVILAGDGGPESWVQILAAALAEEREKALSAVGRCGVESPRMGSLATSICALPAGHAGWHREGSTEWGIRAAGVTE